MFYANSIQRRRSKDFDFFVGSALEVIDRPAAKEAVRHSALGEAYSNQLRALLETAFLPNVDASGIARAPAGYVHTEHLPIVPMNRRDLRRGICIAPSISITEQRITSLATLIRTYCNSSQEDAEQRAGQIVIDLADKYGERRNFLKPGSPGRCITYIERINDQVSNKRIGWMAARPCILIAARQLDCSLVGRTLSAAGLVWHETVHALDMMDYESPMWTDTTPANNSRKEMRPYHYEKTIYAACMPDADLSTLPSFKVENIRLQHNPNANLSADPFATPPALVQDLQQLGVI